MLVQSTTTKLNGVIEVGFDDKFHMESFLIQSLVVVLLIMS